jgi:metal-dependent amidase/aminoacylase/carboxypeptidase family protein
VTWSPDFYPPTINDKGLWDNFASGVAAEVSETKEFVEVVPTMGAEDFGFIAERVPSAFYLLGQGSGEGTDYGLHHPMFSIDENVLMKGVELHVRSAMGSLNELWEEREMQKI